MTNSEPDQRKILVVDDNPAIHDDFRKVLRNHGLNSSLEDCEADLFGETQPSEVALDYKISHALQGKEGLALVERALAADAPFEMAFVDMRMPPGWDGLTTIEHLWAVDPDLQVVICSAYSDQTLADIWARLGVQGKLLILKKPFENSEVCQMAAALSEKRRLDRRTKARIRELESLVEQKDNELNAMRTNRDNSNIYASLGPDE